MGGAASTLELACEESNEEQVKRMIELKMDVNAPSGKKRFTPLHIASSKGNLPIVEALIAAGAALNPVCSVREYRSTYLLIDIGIYCRMEVRQYFMRLLAINWK